MNLDDLKQAWKAANEDQARLVTAEEVSRLLQSRSRTALDRINDGIRFDVVLSVLLAAGTVGWLLWQQAWAWTLLTLVYFGAALVFYRYKYLAINRADLGNDSLRASLAALTTRMRQFLRVYDYMIVLGIPLGAAAGFWLGWNDANPADVRLSAGQIALIAGVAVAFTAGWMVLSRLYVNRLYRKPYLELLACLEELDDQTLH